MTNWFLTFMLTLFVELAVAVPLLGTIERTWTTRVRLVLVANVLTHPVVYVTALWASYRPFFPTAVLGMELGAALLEALVYARAFCRRPWLPAVFTSFFANGASLLASLAMVS